MSPRPVLLIAVCFGLLLLTCPSESGTGLPYAQAGLTEAQAAAHLLERFAFGARPGEVDLMVETGLEKWLEGQLSGNRPDPELENRLALFKSLSLTAREIVNTYPRDSFLRNQMARADLLDLEKMGKEEIKEKVNAYREEKGYRPHRELSGKELPAQKLYRAVYSENQLVEVLTDFWFNHFNVTVQDGQARIWVLSYERDAIRPNVLGNFRDLLGATAKHPAMLHYLDNHQSRAPAPPTERDRQNNRKEQKQATGDMAMGGEMMSPPPKRSKRGINENYARELMELHTLGVDGGYTQVDVVEDGRDLPVTTDFRSVFAEGAGKHLNIKEKDDSALFPGWEGNRFPLIT